MAATTGPWDEETTRALFTAAEAARRRAVREAVERHRDEIVDRLICQRSKFCRWKVELGETLLHEYRDGIEDAFDLLVELAGKEE